MFILGDYHAHTKFCDGNNSCGEMVDAALSRGFVSVGLSSHSYTPFDGGFGMTPEAARLYKAEMMHLKEAYRGKIGIYLGIEQDVWSEKATGYDYIIGAVHYIRVGGEAVAVDVSADLVADCVRKYFGGDWMKYIRAYYELAAEIPRVSCCDFIAHFDLVTKYNEGNRFFDEDSREYQGIAYEALKNAAAGCRIFEMNSGVMRKKYRSHVYTSEFLLRSLRDLGCEIILSSDAHDTSSLGFMFPEMAIQAKECGYRNAVYLTPDGFKEYAL